jgi:2-amino-4-hydroxy-6-hydroxymethyldihydropteridine diphosphokinase
MPSSGRGEDIMPTVYLALGSNVGNRKNNFIEVMKQIPAKVEVEMLSSIYETEPVGYSKQPFFLNAVMRGTTALKPVELLEFVKGIESAMGRMPSFENAPRIIDIDILFYDDKIITTRDLVVPHPHLTVRAFVLVPLNEIDPGLAHPGNKRTIGQLVKDLGEVKGLHWWADAEQVWIRRQNVSDIS